MQLWSRKSPGFSLTCRGRVRVSVSLSFYSGNQGWAGTGAGKERGGWSHILCAELSQETQVTADLGFVSIPGWDAFLILVPR